MHVNIYRFVIPDRLSNDLSGQFQVHYTLGWQVVNQWTETYYVIDNLH